MTEVLTLVFNLVFESFWTWAGTFLTIAVVALILTEFRPLSGFITINKGDRE